MIFYGRMMNYKEINSDKTFYVEHIVGFGDQGGTEDRSKGIVFYTDDLQEAKLKAKELYESHLTEEEKIHGWVYNHFQVNVNTSTVEGKLLLDSFSAESDKRFEELLKAGLLTEVEMYGQKIYIEKDPTSDKYLDNPSTSYSMQIIDLSE